MCATRTDTRMMRIEAIAKRGVNAIIDALKILLTNAVALWNGADEAFALGENGGHELLGVSAQHALHDEQRERAHFAVSEALALK